MSIKTLCVIFCTLLVYYSNICTGQHSSTFSPLKCVGEIPAEFRTLTASKVQKAQAEEKKSNHTYKEKLRINEFLLKNNYIIDELLNSGKVLFGDSLTNYINEVADTLLRDDGAMRQKLRFYAVKSQDVNAFATNQGIIFVTVGLLAQLENEAELAFVLAHEIAHYEKEHSIASVLENEKIYNQTRDDRYNGYESRIKLLSAFSKDMEFQADSLGFLRFKKAGYSIKAAGNMMDVLQLAFMPFDDIEFNPAFLELDSMKIPHVFLLDTLAAIPYDTDELDDSHSSHPNIRRRREKLEGMIAASTESNGKNFILGKTRFSAIRTIARNEIIHLDLLEQQYIDAFYNSYVLSRTHPDDQYLEESMAKALYGLSKYSNSGDFSNTGVGSDDSYSNIQNCYHLFEKLDKDQINLMAIRYNLHIFKKYNSPFIEMLLNDIITEGMENNHLTWTSLTEGENKSTYAINLSRLPPVDPLAVKTEEVKPDSVVVAVAKPQANNDEEGGSKYEKLRITKKALTERVITPDASYMTTFDEEKWNDIFHYRMFTGRLDEDLKNRFDTLARKKELKEEEDAEWTKHLRRNRKHYKNHGYELGIDKVVFVDPFFFMVDERHGLKLVDSEKQLLNFEKQIKACADKCDLKHEILLPKTMTASDIDKYNHMAMMNDWIGEKLSHDREDVEMIPLETAYTIGIADHYGTDYFCYTGIFTSKQRRRGAWGMVFGSIIVPPVLPIMIARALSPKQNTDYYFLLYNVRTGKTKWTFERDVKRSADNSSVNSIMYDTIYQVKHQ